MLRPFQGPLQIAGFVLGQSQLFGYRARLARLDAELAQARIELVVDGAVREMIEAMTKAKAALGPDYDVCGRDGVHPAVPPLAAVVLAEAQVLQAGLQLCRRNEQIGDQDHQRGRASEQVQRDPAAADRCGARASVGLEHIAVDGELYVGHGSQVGGRA